MNEFNIPLEFMISGLVFQSLANGHWTDFTLINHNIHVKIAANIISIILFMYGFNKLGDMIVGPLWSLFLSSVVVGIWMINYSKDND